MYWTQGVKKNPPCDHVFAKSSNTYAYHGKWYQRMHCPDCHAVADRYLRDVDVKDDRDCAAADASQGIL